MPTRSVMNAWKSYRVRSASWEPGVGFTPWGSETRIRSCGGAVVLVDEPAEQIPPADVARTDQQPVRRFGSRRGEAEGAMESSWPAPTRIMELPGAALRRSEPRTASGTPASDGPATRRCLPRALSAAPGRATLPGHEPEGGEDQGMKRTPRVGR